MTRIELRRPSALLAGTRTGTDGPQVLLLHAGGERREVWQPVARRLVAAGYQSVAYDLRGHGESDPAGADELATHVADVAAMIDAEPGPVTVVGASLGGLAAVLAIPAVRLKVAAVVLVDVVTHLDPERVRAYLNSLHEGYGEMPLVADILSRHQELASSTSTLAALPTLLVRAESSAIPDEACQRFLDQLPHATVTTIAKAGHLIARDAPEDLATALLEFLPR
jgi:pimeloyl-ACP methyl ester carboxylesterase